MSQPGEQSAPAPLLETKLHAPRVRADSVHRPRLDPDRGNRHRPLLTLVSAPAGFGKTTLVAEWFADAAREQPVAWLSLDPADSDASRFWTYVIAALQTAAPGVGATALSLLQASQALDSVVASLLNDMAGLTTQVVLVLDDYHVIESTDVHESLQFLLEHLPPQLRLVLATRADPPLPLARLRARGDLLEVRAADLRFTTDEAATYFGGVAGLELTAGDVDALEARTEGWIAALQLAALSMQGRDDIDRFIGNFAGDDRFVVDYLIEEVLERQTPEARTFLLRTAVLDRLTGPLCDAVTGGVGGKAELEALDRANLFLVPLDDRRLWYRYHHLFAEMLRARLLDEQPDLVPELHGRASDWYSANGDPAEAVRHALAGEDFERAARLIELAVPMMRQSRQEATARRWLEALPEDLFPDRPVLTIALVGARMASVGPAGIEPHLQSVEAWLDISTGPPGRPVPPDAAIVFDEVEYGRLPAQVAVFRAGAALLSGNVAETVVQANRALALVEPSDHLRRGAAAALLGLAYWTVGDLEPASRQYGAAVDSLAAAGHIADVLGCSLALADIQIAQGHLLEAQQTFERALRRARGDAVLRGTADMHVGLSGLSLEHDEIDEAALHLQAGAELGERAGLPQNAYRRRVAMARIRTARGDLDGAIELLDEAERVYNTDFSPSVRPVVAMRARAQLARGEVEAVLRWADQRGLTSEDELTYVREYEHVTLARALLAPGATGRSDQRARDAVLLLERLLRAAEAGHRAGSAIEILVLLARAHLGFGDGPSSASALEQALVRAEPEGHVRVFVDELPELTASLQAAARHGAGSAHARRVLAAAGSTRPTGAASAGTGLVEPLSDRELDVLRLLRTDLSGPDIARELMVSLNTMRTHTKSIYSKLGVNSRREAVRRAGELGL